jgi:hypothetical protein
VWQTYLRGGDFSSSSAITFWVRKELGGQPNIYLQDSLDQRSYVNIEDYIVNSSQVTEQWQQVRIPLDRFEVNGVDLKDLAYFQVAFEI